MIFLQEPILIFDFLGLVISMASVAVVAHASNLLVGRLRKGMLSLLWGLFFIAMSFVWVIVTEWLLLSDLLDLRPVILSIGMSLLLISTTRLFRLTRSVWKAAALHSVRVTTKKPLVFISQIIFNYMDPILTFIVGGSLIAGIVALVIISIA